MKLNLNPVVTIDGASGTGKGTISRIIAKLLGFHLLDSGALYRVVGLAAIKHGVSLTDETNLQIIAKHIDVQFLSEDEEFARIILEGEDVTDAIRTEVVGDAASRVGDFESVREALLDRQRFFRNPPGLVADGRDMGTVIFPDAELKIFLEASQEERARRRFNQLKEKGYDGTLDDLVQKMQIRDVRDQTRTQAPLKPAHDAIRINTNGLSVEEVVDRVIAEINTKKAFPVTFAVKHMTEVRVTE